MKKIASQLKPQRLGAGLIAERKNKHVVEVMLYEPSLLNPAEFTEFYNLDEADMVEIDKWVQERALGFRNAYNTWKLINEEAVTMFLLRWNQ